MLHDLSETHGAEHVPDGIHQSGPIQAALRAEVLQVLAEVRVEKALR